MSVLKLSKEKGVSIKEIRCFSRFIVANKTYIIQLCFSANEFLTRECLSSLTFRSDIPADHYEGCRPAATDVRLGHYVNNSIKELDVHR